MSTVPEAWGPRAIFLANVALCWKQEVLHEVLLTQGLGQKDFVLGNC